MKYSFGDRIFLVRGAYNLPPMTVGIVLDEEPDFIEVRLNGHPHAIPLSQKEADQILAPFPKRPEWHVGQKVSVSVGGFKGIPKDSQGVVSSVGEVGVSFQPFVVVAFPSSNGKDLVRYTVEEANRCLLQLPLSYTRGPWLHTEFTGKYEGLGNFPDTFVEGD